MLYEALGEAPIADARLVQVLLHFDCDCERSLAWLLESPNANPAAAGGGGRAGAPRERRAAKPAARGGGGGKAKGGKTVSGPRRTGSRDVAVAAAPSQQQQQQQQVRVAQQPSAEGGKRYKKKIDVGAALTAESAEAKPRLSLVVVGHVDAGKSTLMGHLRHLLGHIDQRRMHKLEVESSKAGKGSFKFAWALDDTAEERARGVTMDVGQCVFETPGRRIVLLDAPGHRDFVPKMIAGAGLADACVLVVDALPGAFESGFGPGGQTREHALLVRSLGVRTLVVAVNKMDGVEWSQARFEEVRSQLQPHLKRVGYAGDAVQFVPVSGYQGGNLLEAQAAPWVVAGGVPTLVAALDAIDPGPASDADAPLRLAVTDVGPGPGSALLVHGRVVAGSVQVGEIVLAQPANMTAGVKSVTAEGAPAGRGAWGVAGEMVALTLSGLPPEAIRVGSVLCDRHDSVSVTTRFRATVNTLQLAVPLIKGTSVSLHLHQACEVGRIRKLHSIIKGGAVAARRPKCVGSKTTADIDVATERPICVEKHQPGGAGLGRLVLRYGGDTIAFGIVTAIQRGEAQ